MPPVGSQSRSFFATFRSPDRVSHQRWVICGLLFLATVIAYVDRGVIAYLKIPRKHHPRPRTTSSTATLPPLSGAYAIGMVVAGRLTDKLGTRKAFAIAIVLWSIAAMLPGAAFLSLTFGVAMFLLGLGEAANFPACIKTVAEWFPKSERALATGIFNSGANIGNIVVPLVVPFSALALVRLARRVCRSGSPGLRLAGLLALFYRHPENIAAFPAELALIQSDPVEKTESVPWSRVCRAKKPGPSPSAKFLTDPIWWFYLFWIPRYLAGHFPLEPRAKPHAGGAGLRHLLRRQHRRRLDILGAPECAATALNVARKTAMLICAVCIAPVITTPFVHQLWVVVALLGLATAAHQGWSATLFTLPSDLFPKAAVASVIGIGGMAGAIGGFLLQVGAGMIVYMTHSYVTLFAIACVAYPLALIIIHIISPKLEPAKIE